MQELIKFLNCSKVREKFFKMIDYNNDNNKILKNKLNKALNRYKYI